MSPTRDDTPSAANTALSATDHRQGKPNAALWLLEYGDYECPFCIQAEPLTRHLVDTFGDRMAFVFRHFPQVEIHPHAELAAEAAEAAAAQGKFWPMHHALFKQTHHLGLPALAGYAESIGLDMLRFNAEMADRIYTQRVQEHRRAGTRIGLRATPTFLLNGAIVDVSFGLDHLEAAIQRALKHP
jgi:protein-disulfide isomerase